MNLKYPFKESNKIKKNYSQVFQDVFVLSMLDGKKSGSYIEIGGYEPVSISNTFLLESEFNWSGFSIEMNPSLVKQWGIRKNKCYCADANVFDYEKHIKKLWGNKTRVDYLSIDVDPAEQTLSILKKLPLKKYRFNVITYEHELYCAGVGPRNESRKILTDLGYELVAKDVENVGGDPFEDWYVDPTTINKSKYRKFKCENLRGKNIFLES
jgi:hypothetical protein